MVTSFFTCLIMNSENSMLFPLFIGDIVNNYHSQKNPICPPFIGWDSKHKKFAQKNALI